jgi:hypothetical protein
MRKSKMAENVSEYAFKINNYKTENNIYSCLI